VGWINTAKIAQALQALLKRELTIVKEVYRGEYINEQAKLAPWVGVYRAPVTYEPRTLGRGADTWEGNPQFRIVVQESSFKDRGMDCEDKLEQAVAQVLNALETDRTLGGTVDTISKYEIDYSYIETDAASIYFQTAFILITTEVQTS
jgi:hypothetical protein